MQKHLAAAGARARRRATIASASLPCCIKDYPRDQPAGLFGGPDFLNLIVPAESKKTAPDWGNPEITKINAEPPHCTLLPYPSAKSALPRGSSASPYHLTLVGKWKFAWVARNLSTVLWIFTRGSMRQANGGRFSCRAPGMSRGSVIRINRISHTVFLLPGWHGLAEYHFSPMIFSVRILNLLNVSKLPSQLRMAVHKQARTHQ